MRAVYEFSAKLITAEGNKMTVTGEVIGEDSEGWPPPSIAEKARAHCEEQFPTARFADDRMVHSMPVKSYPSVRKLKGKTKALQAKDAKKAFHAEA